eukprot:COSAG01_NODE_53287_length_340_cov_0.858921_2_plen_20_part_01
MAVDMDARICGSVIVKDNIL